MLVRLQTYIRANLGNKRRIDNCCRNDRMCKKRVIEIIEIMLKKRKRFPAVKDFCFTAMILCIVTFLGNLFERFGLTDANIVTVYILGVLLISWLTRGYVCGALASIISVSLFDILYTQPRWTLRADDSGYWITFAVMLTSSIITATLATKLKDQAIYSQKAAFHTKTLLETNQLLQKTNNENEIYHITVEQIRKLLRRDVILYPQVNGALDETGFITTIQQTDLSILRRQTETDAVKTAFLSGTKTTNTQQTQCMYYPISVGDMVYGVVGIRTTEKPLTESESDVLQSMLSECAMAIENHRNAKGKQQASLLAEKERLRANLLRMISHDLRTPLTAILGNATNLMSNYEKINHNERFQVFNDIAQDAQWLMDMAENLLFITRVSEGEIHLNRSLHLIDEVIEEAVQQTKRRAGDHPITFDDSDDLLLVRIDTRLMMQVILNLIDNAVKYTPAGTPIRISAKKANGRVFVRIADLGDGIPDNVKLHVFDLFFSGNDSIVDGRRSLGLGLALCRSVILAHGGEISLTDNEPHGCLVTFSIPLDEVDIHV